MDEENLKWKTIVCAVIFILVSVSVVPSIYADTTPNIDVDEYVEFTTEICGLSGYEPNTIKLTQEEADEVRRLLDTIDANLDNADTTDEAIQIFNNAIVELDKYGLLGDLSVDEAQRLITGKIKNPIFNDLLKNRLKRLPENYFYNLFCLVSYDGMGAGTIGPFYLIGMALAYLARSLPFPLFYNVMLFSLLSLFYEQLKIFHYMKIVNLGYGVLSSVGLLGKKEDHIDWGEYAIYGFIGLRFTEYFYTIEGQSLIGYGAAIGPSYEPIIPFPFVN